MLLPLQYAALHLLRVMIAVCVFFMAIEKEKKTLES